MTKNDDVSWMPRSRRISLNEFSTTDIITELYKRDGVECINVTSNDYFEVILNRTDTNYPDIEPGDYGPATIIVVRGQ